MFKNVFQGGPCVEVFSSQGKDPLVKWKLMGQSSIHKVFEKAVKSYVHVLEGAATTTKIQLPKDSKQTCVLIQRYLVLQLFVPLGRDFSIEISVSDMSNNKRRVLFSTAQRDIATTPLHAKVPLTILKRAVWLNLCIDMVSIVAEAFRGQTYKSLDSLTISAACHLRKVFTMKCQLPDDTEDDDLYDCKPSTNDNELDSLPRTVQFAPDVAYQTQVLNINKLRCAEAKLRGDNSRPSSSTEPDLNSSMGRSKKDDKPMHIAFGSKVLVPNTASGKRITSSTGPREESTSAGNRTSRSSHSRTQGHEDSIPSARGQRTSREQPDTLVVHGHLRQKSDPGTELSNDSDVEKGGTLSGSKTWSPGSGKISEEIKPHPPRQKSGDKSRRVIKVRTSSGKERDSSDSNRSRNNSGTTRGGGVYERRRYSSNQDQASAEESSDADAIQSGRHPDAGILRSAAARIRTESISEDEEPLFEVERTPIESHRQSVRTKPESYSESDDLLAKSSQNVASSGRGKVQRRKKKPERGRMDSYSETEENQLRGRIGSGGRPERGRMESYSETEENQLRGRVGSGGRQAGSAERNGRRTDGAVGNNSKKSKTGKRDTRTSDSHADEEGVHTPRQEEEPSGKMYTFKSPPRKAPVRNLDRSRQLDTKKLQMQLEKISISSHDGQEPSAVAMEMPSSARGAELEADFLQGIITNTQEENIEDQSQKNLLTSKERYRSIIQRTPSPRLIRSPIQSQRSPRPGQRSPPVPELSEENERMNSTSMADKGPVPAKGSPTLRRSKLMGNRGDHSDLESTQRSVTRAMSRCSVSSKKLKEIPKDDPRLSISDEYDWRKYQSNNSSLASSMEANMLASLRRQQFEEMLDEEGESHQPASNSFDIHNYGDDDLSSSSSDDTTATFGTYKPPDLSRKHHRYQDEMHFPANGNPLLQSNPRDWGEAFSPPIVLPSERIRDEMDTSGMFLPDQYSPNKDNMIDFNRHKSSSSEEHNRHTESDVHDEDELDLLYDPCLNCYFDPRTGKYYELK